MAVSDAVRGAGSRRRRTASTAACGMVAPVLFVVAFTIDGWTRRDYSSRTMFVSELSLGPHGWVQIVNFLLTGTLVTVFGRGVTAGPPGGLAPRAGPLLLQIIGVSLLVSGPFVTDPSSTAEPATTHGIVHGVFGAIVFSLAPITCLVFSRRFRRDPAWRPFAPWTTAVAAVLTVGVVALKVSQLPASPLFEVKGVVQRVILMTFMGWLFAFATRLRHDAAA